MDYNYRQRIISMLSLSLHISLSESLRQSPALTTDTYEIHIIDDVKYQESK